MLASLIATAPIRNIVVLPESRFHALPDTDDMDFFRKERETTISGLHRLLSEGPLREGGYERVLLPLCGFDIGINRVFSEATVTIGLDDHPFLPLSIADKANIDFRPMKLRAMARQMDFHYHTGGVDYTGLAIVGALYAAIPNFRLRDVTLFETGSTDLWKMTPDKGLHGLVTYDRGADTPISRYLHINATLAPIYDRTYSKTWWFQMLESHPPDAVLVKASQEMFMPKPRGHEHPLRADIIRWLQKTRGVLVEPINTEEPPSGEFFGYQILPETVRLTTRDIDPPANLQFGLSMDARATFFITDTHGEL